MSSLIWGLLAIAVIVFITVFAILLVSGQAFRDELDRITGRKG